MRCTKPASGRCGNCAGLKISDQVAPTTREWRVARKFCFARVGAFRRCLRCDDGPAVVELDSVSFQGVGAKRHDRVARHDWCSKADVKLAQGRRIVVATGAHDGTRGNRRWRNAREVGVPQPLANQSLWLGFTILQTTID